MATYSPPFADKICKLLYSVNTCTSTLLQDIGVFADAMFIDYIADDYENNAIKLVAARFCDRDALGLDNNDDTIVHIFDKLCISEIVTIFVTMNVVPAATTMQIINHSLNNSDVVAAYAHGYRILFNNSIVKITDKFAAALANNMRVTSILSSDNTCDSHIQSCVSLTALNHDNGYENGYNNNITTLKPFAASLRKLSICDWYQLNYADFRNMLCVDSSDEDNDDNDNNNDNHGNNNDNDCKHGLLVADLELCIHLEELNASNNTYITTCAPFAHSLRKLTIEQTSGITDDGLKLCSNLTDLNVSYNNHITTCAPFAKSLRILSAIMSRNINDRVLSSCTNIEHLCANGNSAITTCAPFARTLRILYACCVVYGEDEYIRSCGINDDGLHSCIWLEELYASDNDKITSCDPFAKSLRVLDASTYFLRRIYHPSDVNSIYPCGICDDGLRLCRSIEKLYAYDNVRIKSCDPFAKSLRVLDAYGICGIRDAKLRVCKSITHLYANYNKKIKTCVPFAKTLKVLHAEGTCGISDKELEECINITELYTDCNEKITRTFTNPSSRKRKHPNNYVSNC